MRTVSVSEAPICPEDIYGQIGKDKSGSVLLHYAIVRERTGEQLTTGIEFLAEGDAEAELAGIAEDIRTRFDADDVLLSRRIGKLAIGEVISLVAVSCPRSKDVFEACQYGVGRLKQMIAIRKNEVFEGQP